MTNPLDYPSECSDDLPDELLRMVNNDAQLAGLIYYHLSDDWKAWMDSLIPALGGRKPKNCLKSKAGIKRLKSVLMRFP
jgi:hypothetical protein